MPRAHREPGYLVGGFRCLQFTGFTLLPGD